MCRVGKGFGGSLRLRELERVLCRAGGIRWLRRDEGSAGGSGQVEGAHGVRQELETKVSPPVVGEDGGAGDGHRGHGRKAGVGLARSGRRQGRAGCPGLAVWAWAGSATGFMGTLSSRCWAVAKLQLRVWISLVAFFSVQEREKKERERVCVCKNT